MNISEKKINIKGTGLRRSRLPFFWKLGEFSTELTELSIELCRQNSAYNDIGNESLYSISANSPLRTYFPPTYRQILLQHPLTDGKTESDYKVDHKAELVQALRKEVSDLDFYRARLAVLPPGEKLDWHIDTDTSVSCRLQFIIQGQSLWQIKHGHRLESQVMKAGEIWFANTAFSHCVEGHGEKDRIVLILGCSSTGLLKVFGAPPSN